MLTANTTGRAKAGVRENIGTGNGACAWTRLRERFGKNTGAMCFNEVFQYSWSKDKRVEDVWREWVKKVSKLPTRSVSAQDLENHLRLRAPLSVAKRSNTG